MLVNIRGINGAGKSTTVRKLMKRFPPFRTYSAAGMFTKYKEKILRYDMPSHMHVLGDYSYHSSGGLDGYSPVKRLYQFLIDQEQLVGRCRMGYIVYESVLLSQAKGPIVNIAQRVGKDSILFATLDTPLDLCIERIKERRLKSSKYRKIRNEPNWDQIIGAHARIQRYHDFFGPYGHTLRLDHARPVEHLLEYLRTLGWKEEEQIVR